MDGPDDTVWVPKRETSSAVLAPVFGTGLIVVAAIILVTCLFSLIATASSSNTVESALMSQTTIAARGATAFAMALGGAAVLRLQNPER